MEPVRPPLEGLPVLPPWTAWVRVPVPALHYLVLSWAVRFAFAWIRLRLRFPMVHRFSPAYMIMLVGANLAMAAVILYPGGSWILRLLLLLLVVALVVVLDFFFAERRSSLYAHDLAAVHTLLSGQGLLAKPQSLFRLVRLDVSLARFALNPHRTTQLQRMALVLHTRPPRHIPPDQPRF